MINNIARKPINIDLIASAIDDKNIQCLALSILVFVLWNPTKKLCVKDIEARFESSTSKVDEAICGLRQAGYYLDIPKFLKQRKSSEA